MLISLSAVSAMNNKLSLKGGIFKSAIILTFAGILSKLLGFYFRILLTNYTGAAGVGLFQMCMPLIALAFAVCCSGFSVAVSKLFSIISISEMAFLRIKDYYFSFNCRYAFISYIQRFHCKPYIYGKPL